MGDLQKLSRVTIVVPGKHDAGTVLKRLSKGSKDVLAKISDLGIETAVLVTMECTEVEALKRINFLPYCGGFRAHCLVWKDKAQQRTDEPQKI